MELGGSLLTWQPMICEQKRVSVSSWCTHLCVYLSPGTSGHRWAGLGRASGNKGGGGALLLRPQPCTPEVACVLSGDGTQGPHTKDFILLETLMLQGRGRVLATGPALARL